MASQKKPTVPLTRAQLQTQAGAELLALCQSITEDGTVSDDEIAALKEWLERNCGSDLPAVAFLASTVEKLPSPVLMDYFKRRDLHRALERVLPPEEREKAAEARVQAEQESIRSDPHLLLAPYRVGEIFDFMVAGVGYEGRAAVTELVRPDDMAYFVRDRANKFSKNAIEIRVSSGLQVGFVPEELARRLAPKLDGGCKYHAWFKQVIRTERGIVPIVKGELLRGDTDLPAALREGELPAQGAGFRSAALLREAGGDLDAAGAMERLGPFFGLLKADLESVNHKQLPLADFESFIESCGSVVPELRSYLARHGLASAAAPLVGSTEELLRDIFAQLRPALGPARALEPERVSQLVQRMDAIAPPPVTTAPPAAEPLRAAASAPSTLAPPEKRPSSGNWVIGFLLLAAALAAIVISRR